MMKLYTNTVFFSSCVHLRKVESWGAWVAQPVKRLILAQVIISRFMSSSPALGSVLRAQSLEPASDSVLPEPFPGSCFVSRSLSKISIKKKKDFNKIKYKKEN